MQENHYPYQDADNQLLAAVDASIEHAVKTAGHELRGLGSGVSPEEYFTDGVLRHLFLRICGADDKTYSGGDPEAAWRYLYMARAIARRWEREKGAPLSRRRKDRMEDLERDESEQRQLELSARNFALRTVIRALVDNARLVDPSFAERLPAVVEDRLATLGSTSDTDHQFTEQAKRYLSVLTASLK